MVITYDQVMELTGDYREMSRGYMLTHCPWHEDHEMSLLVFPDGWYKCLAECEGSGRNGNGPLSKLYEELSNPGVIRHSKNGHHEPPPSIPTDVDQLVWTAHDMLRQSDEYKWYLKQRGVEDRIETAKLGWYKGWITIPILSEGGEVVGVYMRATPPQEKLTGLRFYQPEGQKPMLYCPDWRLWKSSHSVAVVFGMFDALVLSSLRIPVITTTGGSKTFNPDWLSQWRKPVVIIPDEKGDDVAAADLAADLGWRAKILRLPYDDYVHDPADYAKMERKSELMRLVASEMGALP